MKISVKIRGVDISEYTIVYPANYTDEQADDIKKLFGSLSKALDENIAVCSQAAPDKNIYIGHGFDDAPPSTKSYSHSVVRFHTNVNRILKIYFKIKNSIFGTFLRYCSYL